eukprot:767454-Hanusia_phi.AAC.6
MLIVPLQGTQYQAPSVSIKCAGLVGKKLIVEPLCPEIFLQDDVNLRNIFNVNIRRKVEIPEQLRSAQDLHVCFEFNHQKPKKRSTKAWSSIKLSQMVPYPRTFASCTGIHSPLLAVEPALTRSGQVREANGEVNEVNRISANHGSKKTALAPGLLPPAPHSRDTLSPLNFQP